MKDEWSSGKFKGNLKVMILAGREMGSVVKTSGGAAA